MGAFLWRCVLCPSCDRYRWRDIAGVKAAEAERIVAVGSRRWKVKARLNLRVPQAVGRGAEAVGVLGGENPGSGAKFYAGLPLALSEPTHLSPGSWGLQP